MHLKELGYTHFTFNEKSNHAQVMELVACPTCNQWLQVKVQADVYQPKEYLLGNGLIELGAEPKVKCECFKIG